LTAAIADTRIGAPVRLDLEHSRRFMRDAKGRVLGRMAKAFSPPQGTRIAHGEVAAILRWRKEYGDKAFHCTLKRDEWEAVLAELVFEEG
jgi:ATP-dependent DNA helicase RecQ